MPYEHAHFIGQPVEIVVHVHASTPNPDNIEIRLGRRTKEPLNLFVIFHAVRVVVDGHLIGALQIYFSVIYLKIEFLAIQNFILMQLDFSNANFYLFLDLEKPRFENNGQIVQRLISKLPGPPELRLPQFHFAYMVFLGLVVIFQFGKIDFCIFYGLYCLAGIFYGTVKICGRKTQIAQNSDLGENVQRCLVFKRIFCQGQILYHYWIFQYDILIAHQNLHLPKQPLRRESRAPVPAEIDLLRPRMVHPGRLEPHMLLKIVLNHSELVLRGLLIGIPHSRFNINSYLILAIFQYFLADFEIIFSIYIISLPNLISVNIDSGNRSDLVQVQHQIGRICADLEGRLVGLLLQGHPKSLYGLESV